MSERDPESLSFEGHTVLITGAGRGLGRAHALLLASMGANIVVNDASLALDGREADDDTVARTIAEVEALTPGTMVSGHDITDPEAVDEMISLTVERFGGLHAVINNAGFIRDRSLVNMPDDDLRAVLDVHLLGSALVARSAMRVFRTQNYGRLVMTTSGAGLYGNPGQANYGAAKMGVVGLTKVLALEGSRYGVMVNAVAPAARTRMTESIPLGRVAEHLTPEHVSPVFAVLASAACPSTGEIYEAGAGMFRRVVVAATQGWFSGIDGPPTPQELLSNWEHVSDVEGFVVPGDAVAANRTLFAAIVEELRR